MAVSSAAVLAAALSLSQYVGDKVDTPEGRETLYRPVAEAIAEVARTNVEASMLLALAFHESGLARFVIEGRCADGPPGQRCDGGRARGVFQLHESACREAWKLEDGSVPSIRAEARCAIRLLRWNADRGKDHTPSRLHAAFAGYAAREWNWDGAAKRVETAQKLERVLLRVPQKKSEKMADSR
ncbi:MAG TPA: hypothetical protein VF395_17540 [Polyangiaceae bacterium]